MMDTVATQLQFDFYNVYNNVLDAKLERGLKSLLKGLADLEIPGSVTNALLNELSKTNTQVVDALRILESKMKDK